MNKKTQQKWQKSFPLQKKLVPSISGSIFKTHDISFSHSQIVLPQKHSQMNKNNQIFVIKAGKQIIYAQITDNQEAVQQSITEISILKNLVDSAGIQVDANGSFKGQITLLQENVATPQQGHIQIAQILVKQTYFSRRDQYKVLKIFREFRFHAYVKKILYLDEIQLQICGLMKNNPPQVIKTGIIDKNTRVIFRSACAKSTIAVQIAQETFKYDAHRQIYIQKMLKFLLVYFQRNSFFNNKHRVDIIFFGRLFYPQFQTLSSAYLNLVRDISSHSLQDKLRINFAVALQKDHKGRIYQDFFRRIIWPGNTIQNFVQFFWQKISQLLFTINWDFDAPNQAKFMANSIGRSQKEEGQLDQYSSSKVQYTQMNILNEQFKPSKTRYLKPFIHRLRSKLACSKQTNLFEAVSLISEQYSHHYYLRSLKQTGNSIVIVSAGTSQYQVDETTYKMAKSYVYLTNISSIHVNLNLNSKQERLKVKVNRIQEKPRYKNKEDIKKLENLICWCMQEDIYLSPTNERMSFREDFQLKSAIFPDEIINSGVKGKQDIKLNDFDHECRNQTKQHFYLKQSSNPKVNNTSKYYDKQIQWIQACFFDEQALKIHQKFYEKAKFHINLYQASKNKYVQPDQELANFQDELRKIITGKKSWLQVGPNQNNVSKIIKKFDKRNQQQVSRRLFQNQVLTQNQMNQLNPNFRASSRQKSPSNQQSRYRKGSDQIWNLEQIDDKRQKINIFDITYDKRQYTAIHYDRDTIKKKISHNKYRLRYNFNESFIHNFLPHFSEIILKQFKGYIRRQYLQPLSQQQKKMIYAFKIEKQWKKICFPILTPIFTKCNQILSNESVSRGQTNITDDTDFQQQIARRLMENYQIIQDGSSNYNLNQQYKSTVRLSKGHIIYVLERNDSNLSVSFVTDKDRQQRIVPFMLYRYLAYEERDARFCSKYINFANKNFYNHQYDKYTETKSVRIVFIFDGEGQRQSMKKQHYQQFIKCLQERYKQIRIQVSQGKVRLLPDVEDQKKGHIQKQLLANKVQVQKFEIFFNKREFKFYKHQGIICLIDKTFNYSHLFSIVVQWSTCASALVNQFVQKVRTAGRINKLKSFLMTTQDPFHIKWSIQTIAEIVFNSELGIEILEDLILSKQWLWGNNDWYLNSRGNAFIKFRTDKRLILWKDNVEFLRRKNETENKQEYYRFFLLAASYDFVGQMIEDAINQALTQTKNLANQKKIDRVIE